MKKAFGDYRWLAGRGRYAGTLWLGGDHLLVIENSGFILPFRESYRRIDYKNIQAITYAPTKTGGALTTVMVVLLAFLTWGILTNLNDVPAASIFFGALAAPVLIALIAHLARGATCACQLQTAVQVLKLRPVNRVRTARRVLDQLDTLCRAHQSALPAEPPASPASAQVQVASPAMPPGVPTVPLPMSLKPPWQGSRLATTALGVSAFAGAVGAGELFVQGMPYYLFDVVLSVASIVLIIAAAARIVRFRAPPVLKSSIWGLVVLNLIGLLVGYGLAMFSMFRSFATIGRGSPARQFSMWEQMANATIATYGSFAWVLIGMNVAAILLSLMGLPAAQGRTVKPEQASDSTPPSSPVPPGQIAS